MNQTASTDAIVITKVDTTKIIDPVIKYELKIPVTQTDDFGNKVTFYKREILSRETLESRKQTLLDEIAIIDNKLLIIDSL